MDYSWHHRPPPIPGNSNNICPICSISHFPFCPPPPFIENPRFHPQSPNDYFHQRPRFDHHHPFPPNHHHHEPPMPYQQRMIDYNCNFDNEFVDRRPPWHGSNPSLDVNPYGVGDSPMAAKGNYDNYYRSGVGHDNYGYDYSGVKRMRSESTDSGRGSPDMSRFSSENERILKLIRDHGNSAPGGFSQSRSDVNGYVHESSGEYYEARDHMGTKRRREMSEFHNMERESALFARPGLDLHGGNREDLGVVSGMNNTHYDRRDELGLIENSAPHSIDHCRFNSPSAGRFSSMERSEQTPDEITRYYRGAAPYHTNPQRIETLHENHHNLQQLSPTETTILNKPHYSNPSHNQLTPPPFAAQHHLQQNYDSLSPCLAGDIKKSPGVDAFSQDGVPSSVGYRNSRPPYGWLESKDGHYPPTSFGINLGQREVSHAYSVQPPLPASPPPPPPPPMDPPRNQLFEPLTSAPANKPYLFPIAVSSSADLSSSRPVIPENQSSAQAYHTNKASHNASTVSSAEELHAWQSSSQKYVREAQPFPLRNFSSEKPNTIEASHIFKQPYRTTRPDHFVIILRGLPGSGKSYLAKMLRDLEVENGGEAPRIHSMDEYFMTEVEKADENEVSKSSGSIRGKRPVMKKVMEYCYEPEMEEAYRASMLKAFKKTLDEGVYSFIIVDDRNLRVADFAQFWATAKRSGYEVYLLEAGYKDPAGCAARNVHNFTQDDIEKMARQWEEAPSLYLKLDIKSLLHGDGFEESGIQEVDMDMEDGDPNPTDTSHGSDVKSPENTIKDPVDDFTPDGPQKDEKHLVGSHPTEVTHLSRSKWSDDLDDGEFHEAEGGRGNTSALSGLIQAYSKEGKSVRWGDEGANVGFSISAARKTNARSLVIGPGSGYNLKSNPLSEEENLKPDHSATESKRQTVFQERMRAERESFKAVFEKRRHRIGGFNIDEE